MHKSAIALVLKGLVTRGTSGENYSLGLLFRRRCATFLHHSLALLHQVQAADGIQVMRFAQLCVTKTAFLRNPIAFAI